MSEFFILEFIPCRIAQLGYNKYHIRYKDLVVDENSTLSLSAYNSLWFIVGNPLNILIESDYGVYDTLNNETDENIHQHRGSITITNTDHEKKRITFIEVIILN